jgi:hypothetical protein
MGTFAPSLFGSEVCPLPHSNGDSFETPRIDTIWQPSLRSSFRTLMLLSDTVLHTAGKKSISLSKLHRSLFYLQAFYHSLIPWPDVRTMMLLRLQREWSSCRRFRFHPSSHKPFSNSSPSISRYTLPNCHLVPHTFCILISILGGIPAFLPCSTNHIAYLPPLERTPKSRILCLGVTAKVLVLLKPVLEQQLGFQS